MPDGPHWYGGIRKQQKDTAVVQGPEWSPYWEDARKMDKAEANLILATICKSMPGCELVQESDAKKDDGWELVEHEGQQAFRIRAKYMSKGQIVKMPGYASRYRVVSRNEKEFTLHLCDKRGKLTSADLIYIGVNSDKRVVVVGEKKEVEA